MQSLHRDNALLVHSCTKTAMNANRSTLVALNAAQVLFLLPKENALF
jgi:hypothetical protein